MICKIEFDQLRNISAELKNNQVVDLSIFKDADEYVIEHLEIKFKSLKEFIDWIVENYELIDRHSRLIHLNYLLDSEYYRQRFEGKYKKVFLILRDNDAIISTVEVVKSIPITCDTYDEYKKEIVEKSTMT